MELIGILVILLLVVLGVKLLAFFLELLVWLLTLPFQILAFVLVGLVLLFILPFIVAGLFIGLFALPFLLLGPLLPWLLALAAVYLIARHRRS